MYKVVDAKTNTVTDSRVYDVFGNLVSQSGTTKSNLGFQGKYYDQESELNYFYHRYYSPQIGRFTTEDPILFAGGKNFFTLANNNPINFFDPYGLANLPCEDEIKNSPNWCKDQFSILHGTARCYRGLGFYWGQEWCFTSNGTCYPSHDIISPAIGRAPDGSCINNVYLIAGHMFNDVIPYIWTKFKDIF